MVGQRFVDQLAGTCQVVEVSLWASGLTVFDRRSLALVFVGVGSRLLRRCCGCVTVGHWAEVLAVVLAWWG